MEYLMKKPWHWIAILVAAYPFLSLGFKLIESESIVTVLVYFGILAGLVVGIILGLRQKPVKGEVIKPSWEETLNQRQ
jgi:hypothetical protein